MRNGRVTLQIGRYNLMARKIFLYIIAAAVAQFSSPALSQQTNHAQAKTYEETVIIWDVEMRKKVRILRGHSGSVLSLAFSRDSKWLVTGSIDNDARLWKIEPNF